MAKTTVTKFCGDSCAKRNYKKRKKEVKIKKSEKETVDELMLPHLTVQSKDYLEIKELFTLLGLSSRTAYRLIKSSQLHAIKLGNKYIIRRKDLERMFEK